MSIARDISRQTSRQTATLTASQTAVTVTGGFSSSTVEAYLNGAKLIQGSDYTLNGTSGITLTQGASAGDIIEFSIRNSSNSGLSAINTNDIVDESITYDKLSNSATETDNLRIRVARAWVQFAGNSAGGTNSAKTIKDSFNVSSVIDKGVGQYDVYFTTPMPNANYAVTTGGGDTNNFINVRNIYTTHIRLNSREYNNTLQDSALYTAAVYHS